MGSGELLNSEGMMFVFLSWICKFSSSISSGVLFATINVKICSLRDRAMLPWQKNTTWIVCTPFTKMKQPCPPRFLFHKRYLVCSFCLWCARWLEISLVYSRALNLWCFLHSQCKCLRGALWSTRPAGSLPVVVYSPYIPRNIEICYLEALHVQCSTLWYSYVWTVI